MPTYQIDLVLQEPATFGESPAVGNDVSTLDFIPATTLRGALAAALTRRTPPEQINLRLQACFGEVFPRWTPAFPVKERDNQICVPMPLTWVEEKGEARFGFLSTAHVDPLPETVGQYRLIDVPPDGYADDWPLAWKPARSHWLAIDREGIPTAEADVPKGNHMHLALHYARQSHREQQLFSRTGIESSGVIHGFRTFVADPLGILQPADQVRELYLGKRRSAGNGRATLSWKSVPPRFWPGNPPDGGAVLVQLMTDAILPGGSGGLLRAPEPEMFPDSGRLGIGVKSIASDWHEYPGWSTKWGLPRESALTVAAGSVFRIESGHPDFAAWLETLAAEGIGLRRNEGFGWVAVNPAWLSFSRFRKQVDAGGGFGDPLDWPGVPSSSETADVSRRHLRQLRDRAENLRATGTGPSALSRQRLRGIAALSQRVDDTASLVAFLNRMADRRNTREWDQTRDVLSGPLNEDCGSIHEARFFLEAAVTYSPEE